ncbi:sphingolipid delta(4)-desaturase/C4-monooxygenase DES2 isoform X5 [Fukomys damarensis]|uniref:sphingolipid delta(4)-desaturase/C4-monooxygenase DES2 isoform X5 n=1 Tax=Fukomys damarensis TaxID=885580 RepID=UPI00053FF3F3|nr:sphingolipid delta(4)-desaturase/C4-monooxygenase DES2 isoform X5 [Fukomys damarensis]
MLLWKVSLLPNNNHLPFHPSYLQAKVVDLNGPYGICCVHLPTPGWQPASGAPYFRKIGGIRVPLPRCLLYAAESFHPGPRPTRAHPHHQPLSPSSLRTSHLPPCSWCSSSRCSLSQAWRTRPGSVSPSSPCLKLPETIFHPGPCQPPDPHQPLLLCQAEDLEPCVRVLPRPWHQCLLCPWDSFPRLAIVQLFHFPCLCHPHFQLFLLALLLLCALLLFNCVWQGGWARPC